MFVFHFSSPRLLTDGPTPTTHTRIQTVTASCFWDAGHLWNCHRVWIQWNGEEAVALGTRDSVDVGVGEGGGEGRGR